MRGEIHAASLFDVEDVTDQPRVADMTISRIPGREVDEFARRYHYAGTGGNVSWAWGLWSGATLHGVVAYNLPTRSVCASVFGEEHLHRVWHMGRLILSDDTPHNAESRLIGASLRAIRREFPETWGVLTYAATDAGHIGYAYQATNALYTGEAGHSTYYIDAKGNRRADYFGGAFVSSSRAAGFGWRHCSGGPKHRYLYILGSKRQRRERLALLRYPVLPCPKGDAA